MKENGEKTLGDIHAENNISFPWGLLDKDETEAIDRMIRGTASATSGGVILSAWQCLKDERVRELSEQAQKIISVTSGGAAFGEDLWRPKTK